MIMKKLSCYFFLVLICIFITGCSFNTAKDQYYLVVFESNGGVTIPSQKVKPGDNAVEPEIPVKKNYSFIGWYVNGDIFDFDMPINRDLTIEARWRYIHPTEEYEVLNTVTFLLNNYDEPYYIETLNTGSLVGVPPVPIRSGYIFKDWQFDNDTFDFNSNVSSDIKLLASWDRIDGKQNFMVYFDPNGGTSVDNQVVAQGNRAVYPVPPTRNGYIFDGWTLDGETYNFDMPVNGSFVLVANWTKNGSGSSSEESSSKTITIKKTTTYYTVAFDTGNGSKIPNQTIEAGKKVKKPTPPTRKGYAFRGWNYNGSLYNFDNLVTSSMVLYALWEEQNVINPNKVYTITFDSNKGSVVPEQKVYENATIKVPTNPTKDGYTFNGWFYNGRIFDFNTKVKSDMHLKASWALGNSVSEKQYYDVTFYFKDDTDRIEAYTVEGEDHANRPIEPYKEGYTFNYWALNNKRYDFSTPVTSNITLVANWVKEEAKKYTVDFQTDSIHIPSQIVESGKKVNRPNNPSKPGYKFLYWLYNGEVYNFDSVVTSNMTLVAKYTENDPDTFVVAFASNGGTSVDYQNVVKGETATKPQNPVREGYDFKEWQLNGKTYNFSTPVKEDIILKAVWEERVVVTHIVSFNSDNGMPMFYKIIEDGKTVSRPNNPTRSGETFVEWQLNGKTYNFSTPVTKDITLTAVWKVTGYSGTSTYYNVKFNSNGGTAISNQKVYAGNKITRPSDPTKAGYQFVEWQLGGVAYNFDLLLYTDATLEAVWREIPKNTYTITFNSNGGSYIQNQTVIEGKTGVKPADPTKNGYQFVEWQLNGKTFNFSTKITESITLNAIWNEKTKNTYTVTFNSNGGTTISNQKVTEGGTAVRPANPTKNGYEFVEWQLGGNTYYFGSKVNSNITLNAVWRKKSGDLVNNYPVYFNSNGGNYIQTQYISEGGTVIRPANPTKNGYEFVEWQLNGFTYNFSTPVTKSITLYAKWKDSTKNIYTVTFNTGSGSSVPTQHIEEGGLVVRPANPTRTGYKFVEWQLNGITYNFSSKVTKNITLTAVWKQNTILGAVPISYNKSSGGKSVYINNPNVLSSKYYADSGYKRLIYRDSAFNGNMELYFSHITNDQIYYAVRFYNPNSTSITLRVNRSGVTVASNATQWNSVATSTWDKYYSNRNYTPQNTYTIEPKKVLYFYVVNNGFVNDHSKSSKITGYFDGVLNLTSSGNLEFATLAFTTDYTNTLEASYPGNAVDQPNVYTGSYNYLPHLYNDATFEVNDDVSAGTYLPVKYNSKTYNGWLTNSPGGYLSGSTIISENGSFNSDIFSYYVRDENNSSFTIRPYTSSSNVDNRTVVKNKYGMAIPYNFANWGVHYHENITIKNTGSKVRTISFILKNSPLKINGKALVNNVKVELNSTNLSGNTVSNVKLSTTNQTAVVWTIKVNPGRSVNIPAIFVLASHSDGGIQKMIRVDQ